MADLAVVAASVTQITALGTGVLSSQQSGASINAGEVDISF